MVVAFRRSDPQRVTTCAVFSSPHSGAHYPDRFMAASRLGAAEIRTSEDMFVDQLFASVPQQGAPLLSSVYARAYVDLNRAADELDPALVAGVRQTGINPRVAAGLGVIPRVVSEGREIRNGKITLEAARERIEAAYWPYHQTLRGLLDEQRERFGMAVLFDCHSMPHEALAAAPLVGTRRPDVILGDRFGMACDRWIMDGAAAAFMAQGFTVARNAPFAGGHITRHYGRPSKNQHALQIEIDRALYMDEARQVKRPDFEEVRRRIGLVAADLAALVRPNAALAAE
ncbi:N-formylglutamate amidohydrolase [Oceanomicrobium pacificus]|uniref:N-formylglutamate amidohydrolase n=1 Tax=Oceanomicrobium pacificus TaxID=2692916 RepID=A0A6B0TTL4_9RHOB|nr:N-formylglutamate amidohydrolase [Oceanomicrobium pacificus]MXU64998.1 N-formylglutamate amidohydrolase [Oceanomicrobium pacificus]